MSHSSRKVLTGHIAEATETKRGYRDSIPYLIGAVANLLSARGARLYREVFDIGLTEWRLMWVLGHESPITAATASHIMGTDKGAVSRAVAGLDERGLVILSNNPADGRERAIELSPAGWGLHAKISAVAQLRHNRILSIYSAEECALLKDLLARLLGHIPQMDETDLIEAGQAARKSKTMPRARRYRFHPDRAG